MKKISTFYAKSILIGLIAGTADYYIDIVDLSGNWQTIGTGSLKYVKSLLSQVIFI